MPNVASSATSLYALRFSQISFEPATADTLNRMRASHRAKASLAALCVVGIGPCGSAWHSQNDAAATPQQVNAVPVLP